MAQQKRHGFTLIELLVVTIIIGILAALITPAIMAAMRRGKEFRIQKNIQDLNGAIASFKTKYGIHPIDFRYPDVIDEFVDRLSQRHQYGSASNTIFFDGNELENPYFGAIEGSPQWRDPETLDAAEGYVFLLHELSSSVEYPLGYVPGTTAGQWVQDPQYQQNSFYAFKDTDLTDIDSDGWPEFTPAVGPQVPYCYFDSRSYVTGINNGDISLPGLVYVGPDDAGLCYPYSDYVATLKASIDPTMGTVFEETDSYQIISAGLDGVYGKGAADNPGFRYSQNDDNQLTAAHRDNFVSFREGRLEVGYINN